MEWIGMDKVGMVWNGMDWDGFDGNRLVWIGRELIGMEWIGSDGIQFGSDSLDRLPIVGTPGEGFEATWRCGRWKAK